MKENKKKYVKVCPKCKSTDFALEKSIIQQLGMLPNKYICNNCNYSGIGYVEIKVNQLNEFEEKVNKEKVRTKEQGKSELIDTSYGHFIVNVFWKIISPIFILMGLMSISKNITVGLIYLISGVTTFYFAYFKKKKK